VLAVSWKGCTLMLKNAPVLMISYGLIQGITFLFSNSLFLIILVFHLFAQPNVQFFYGCYW
jgi:membrane protein insertase Oxa1/YidC/SpoIIIJ